MTATPDDDRRRYWTQQMNAAHRFMTGVLDVAIVESGEGLREIGSAADAAGVELVCSDRPHERGLPRLFHLRRGLVDALIAVGRDLNESGLVLRVEDALRTPEMQANLFRSDHVVNRVIERVRWEVGHDDPSPELVYRRLMCLVATTPKTGTHLSGSAVDVSVVDRESGALLDRGGPYLELSERTPMESPFVSEAARANRRTITAAFERRGFVAYPHEFWHYSAGDAFEAMVRGSREPARYGPVQVDLATGEVVPLVSPAEPLGGGEAVMAWLTERLHATAGPSGR